MQDQIDAPLRGPAIDGRGKGGINRCNQVMFARQGGDLFEVNYSHRGIGRRLDVQDLCIGADGAFVLLQVIGVNEGGFYTQLLQPQREEFDYSAINVALRYDVVSGFY